MAIDRFRNEKSHTSAEKSSSPFWIMMGSVEQQRGGECDQGLRDAPSEHRRRLYRERHGRLPRPLEHPPDIEAAGRRIP
jgi:hypothetical protein